jgi:hypothetical protein
MPRLYPKTSTGHPRDLTSVECTKRLRYSLQNVSHLAYTSNQEGINVDSSGRIWELSQDIDRFTDT